MNRARLNRPALDQTRLWPNTSWAILNAATPPCLLLALLAACPSVSDGQQDTNDQALATGPVPAKRISDLKFKHPSFTFVRIQYSSGSPGHSSSTWRTDYPDADLNFTARFQKETGLKCERDGKVMTLTNPELSRFPFIYIAEGGRLQLSDAEVASLRRYLTGGGFLMVDDFWGENEWNAFHAEMKRVFPERAPVELPIDHPVTTTIRLDTYETSNRTSLCLHRRTGSPGTATPAPCAP